MTHDDAPRVDLDGATPETVRRALDEGDPLPGTRGFAGQVDGALVRDVETMSGSHNHCEIRIENLRVPGDRMLGGRGQGREKRP